MSRSLDHLTSRAKELAQALLDACEQRGFPLCLTATFRTYYEQDRLYAQGRTEPGTIVTYARAGESSHNYGLAFDVAFKSPPAAHPFDGNPWETIGEIGRQLGLEWGGDWTRFVDRPHFQIPTPVSLQLRKAAFNGRLRRGIGAAQANVRELQELLNRAGFDAGTVDGDFGPHTEEAVQRLQASAGLLRTGAVHPRELGVLERSIV